MFYTTEGSHGTSRHMRNQALDSLWFEWVLRACSSEKLWFVVGCSLGFQDIRPQHFRSSAFGSGIQPVQCFGSRGVNS